MIGVNFDAFHRAEYLTLGFIKVPHAFCAAGRVDYVVLRPHMYGRVRALRFADVAVDAFVGDTQGHDFWTLLKFARLDGGGYPFSLAQVGLAILINLDLPGFVRARSWLWHAANARQTGTRTC